MIKSLDLVSGFGRLLPSSWKESDCSLWESVSQLSESLKTVIQHWLTEGPAGLSPPRADVRTRPEAHACCHRRPVPGHSVSSKACPKFRCRPDSRGPGEGLQQVGRNCWHYWGRKRATVPPAPPSAGRQSRWSTESADCSPGDGGGFIINRHIVFEFDLGPTFWESDSHDFYWCSTPTGSLTFSPSKTLNRASRVFGAHLGGDRVGTRSLSYSPRLSCCGPEKGLSAALVSSAGCGCERGSELGQVLLPPGRRVLVRLVQIT